MLVRPAIDPVALHLGPIDIHWYGVMYLIGFMAAYVIASRNAPKLGISSKNVEDLIFFGGIGVIAGGRIGYILFYQTEKWLSDPLFLFKVWEGGMSFHGGLIGVLCAVLYLSRAWKRTFWQMVDFVAPLIPIGIGFGRIGNFINNELWGKVSDVPWAMAPLPGLAPRHPSQLYEAFLEGLVLFVIVHWVYSKNPRIGVTSAVFAIVYGLFRFMVEFVRVPDPQLGYLALGWLTMGQLLTIPLIATGCILIYCSRKKTLTHHQHDNKRVKA